MLSSILRQLRLHPSHPSLLRDPLQLLQTATDATPAGAAGHPASCRYVQEGSYHGQVTSAYAFELPPDASPLTEAVDAAEHGQVVYLTRNGEPIAAVVPADVAAAGAAAVEALEDGEDIRAARAALAEPGPDVPMSEVWADYADILGPYPETR